MVVMLEGNAIDVNDEHSLKIESPRVVMLEGNEIDVNDEHPAKTLL